MDQPELDRQLWINFTVAARRLSDIEGRLVKRWDVAWFAQRAVRRGQLVVYRDPLDGRARLVEWQALKTLWLNHPWKWRDGQVHRQSQQP